MKKNLKKQKERQQRRKREGEREKGQKRNHERKEANYFYILQYAELNGKKFSFGTIYFKISDKILTYIPQVTK